ncbi:hypothetical protein [Streptomyces sp. NBC_00096]|uniref:hypothetical protein n=1 Tax=Streptomyces sp. NBC_00096 TaxID=2975650 RepID=UPI0032457860
MNEDRKKRQDEEQVLRSLRGGAPGADRGLHGLTRASAGEGQEALRQLLRTAPGATPGTADGGTGDAAAGSAAGSTADGSADSTDSTNSTNGAAAGTGPAAGPAAGTKGPAGEEQVLRDLLHGVVGGLEPSGDALERLRYAVPARRVRKQRIVLAAVAAALVVGTSVPAAVYLTAAEGDSKDRSTMAGHGQQGADRKGGLSNPHQNGSTKPKPSKSPGKGQSTPGATGAAPTAPGTGFPGITGPDVVPPGAAVSPRPGVTRLPGGGLLPPPAAPGVPACSATQLGVSGSAQPPAADGKVYGSFRVTNVSVRGCTVLGPDTVTAAPAAGPEPGKGGVAVPVVGHTTGDPATGLLPDPSMEAPLMVLAPSAAYEVRFAWVPPAEGCPGAGGSGAVNPPDGGVAGAPNTDPGTGTGADGAAKGPESETNPPAPVPEGVSVSHTADTTLPGGPTTQTTIPDACGGTVYRTGVIPVSDPGRP